MPSAPMWLPVRIGAVTPLGEDDAMTEIRAVPVVASPRSARLPRRSVGGPGRPLRRRLDPGRLLSPSAQLLRRAAIATALASGCTVRPDTVTVVLAARAHGDAPERPWTATLVQELLWRDIPAWCTRMGCELPVDAPEALWAVLDVVAGPDRALHAELVAPLVEAGGLTAAGRRRHPSGRRAG
jgi:hypothetical protein